MRTLRWAAFILVLASGAMMLVSYPRLPERIPIHYNFSGEADGWGPRNSIFVLVAVFTVLSAGVTWLSARPQLFNYPVMVTEVNAQACYREGERLMVLTSASLAALYCSLSFSTVTGKETGLFTSLAIGAMFAAIVIGVVRIIRASQRS